jgi:ADP-heptose:LPS heptosyltransferase
LKEIPRPRHVLVVCVEDPTRLLLALPVFQSLRKAFPGTRLTALTLPGLEGILQGHPAVDDVVTAGRDAGLSALSTAIRKAGPDVCVNLYPRSRAVLAAWQAKVPVRIGERHKWHGFFQTHTVPIQRAVSDRNEVEYNFELLKPLGVNEFAARTEFPLGPGVKEKAVAFLGEKGVKDPYVIVHPGAKGKALHWKAEKFGQLIGQLCQVKGLRVVLTHAPQEGNLAAEATSFLFTLPEGYKPVLVNTGDLDLGLFAALCQGALCVVGGPLGPMGLAAAVGTPTVTIFSPAPEATPLRWGAWGNEHRDLIPKNSSCVACQVGYCKKHDPMDALSVPEVLEAIKPFLRKAVSI